MNDVVGMTVLESPHDLLKEPPRFILCHLPSSDDVFEELSGQILDHHDDIGGSVDYVVAVGISPSAMSSAGLRR